MKRFGVVALLLLAFAVAAAAQGKPVITIEPLTPVVFPAAVTGCGFDILASPQAGRPNVERVILFTNSELVVGPLFVTFQNLTTNKTVDVNISGPGSYSGSNNTFTFHGPSFVILPESVAQAAGLPRTVLINGRLVLTYDDQFNAISASFSGTAQDACALVQ
jgi:hypothetical protein